MPTKDSAGMVLNDYDLEHRWSLISKESVSKVDKVWDENILLNSVHGVESVFSDPSIEWENARQVDDWSVFCENYKNPQNRCFLTPAKID
jgi:hypothetical protein